jgi:hypothetical protein
MATEMGLRHAERRNLYRVLKAQRASKCPEDFEELVSSLKVEMEPEDVKLVLQELAEWKNS